MDGASVDDLSRLVIGTAAIGMAYGLARRNEEQAPTETEAQNLLLKAHLCGIRIADTAPSYGRAEERLGRWWPTDSSVWTKIGKGDSVTSFDESRRLLRRNRVDLFQWHNWQEKDARDGRFISAWERMAGDNRCVALGATTYGPNDALAAVRSRRFAVVQMEWNLFNQGALRASHQIAIDSGVKIAVRSVLLQGVLAGVALPESLGGLSSALATAHDLAERRGTTLARLAIRAALDQPGVRWVLVGVDRIEHLEDAVAAANMEPLDATEHDRVRALDRSWDPLVDPRNWGNI
jgi:aryl-alcohol dehydrogenase-like predicted oxidoreductase